MSTSTVSPQVWQPPSVNLLPPEVEQGRRFRRLQLGLGAVVLAAVIVVALLYVVASREASDAQATLDATEAQGARLQSQVAQFAEVPRIFATVEAAEKALRQATSDEIRWSYYVADLSNIVPSTVWLNNMTVAMASAEAGATGTSGTATSAPTTTGAAPTTGTGSSLGTVTFTGSAYTHDDVATFLEALGKQKGYADPYLSNSTKRDAGGQSIVDFSCQVQITDEALWRNYKAAAGGG